MAIKLKVLGLDTGRGRYLWENMNVCVHWSLVLPTHILSISNLSMYLHVDISKFIGSLIHIVPTKFTCTGLGQLVSIVPPVIYFSIHTQHTVQLGRSHLRWSSSVQSISDGQRLENFVNVFTSPIHQCLRTKFFNQCRLPPMIYSFEK